MAEEKKKLFRQKSLETIESPESLTDYLRVTSPRVWLLLGAIMVVMLGVVLWGVFGRIDTSIHVAVTANDKGSVCYIPADAIEAALKAGTITVDGRTATLQFDALEPEVVSEDTDVLVRINGDLSYGDIVYRVAVLDGPETGSYSGTLRTESLQPISLLLN